MQRGGGGASILRQTRIYQHGRGREIFLIPVDDEKKKKKI